uniref:CMP/dCMP-type deaminase domain-containing protein n=1 Tax=Chlamydomonas euryale TaxID=1486919 RepID=A0A7R9VM15_9CHLO|mmetsp:Transcript_38045/g.112636  ORF Transcript_38045/g.112636 Transcript_38045/m.112636 type:complete len:210 (+) Transcript_38045:80-709(+)
MMLQLRCVDGGAGPRPSCSFSLAADAASPLPRRCCRPQSVSAERPEAGYADAGGGRGSRGGGRRGRGGRSTLAASPSGAESRAGDVGGDFSKGPEPGWGAGDTSSCSDDADSRGMAAAIDQARAAASAGEVPVGAALLDEGGRIVASDHNRTVERNSPLSHAELLVLEAGAAAIGGWRLLGCTLYVTCEPCPMCAGAGACRASRPARCF